MFNTGDRVISKVGVGWDHGKNTIGTVGTITKYYEEADMFGVIFDDYVGGHNLDGECEMGFGWYCSPKEIDMYEETDNRAEEFESDVDVLGFLGF